MFGFHGFSAIRRSGLCSEDSRLLPPVSRRTRQLSFVFHGFINSPFGFCPDRTDCFGTGYTGDPNEDFNIRPRRPGQGVISPPGASHHREHRPGGKVGEVSTDGDSWGSLWRGVSFIFSSPSESHVFRIFLLEYRDFLENSQRV